MSRVKLLFSGACLFLLGFITGVYLLPIMIAPASHSMLEIATASQQAKYTVSIPNNLKDSDFLHSGKGEFYISNSNIVFKGSLTPGPDYQLYLSKHFVESESQFKKLKASMINIGEVKRFDGFIKPIPDMINIEEYTTLIVWCEAFEEFITAAQYKE